MNNKDSIETRIKQYFEDLFLEDSDYLDYELVYNFFIDILINENYPYKVKDAIKKSDI